MDIRDAIYHRRSIRSYSDQTPSREQIVQLIKDAVQAPNSINRQAWAFTVVTGRARLADLSREAKAHATASPAVDIPAGLRSLLASETFNIFYDASALIIISATTADDMSPQDCCLAASMLMLSAYSQGMGTCWVGFAEGWLRTAQAKSELRIPPGHRPIAPIIVGYPRVAPEKVSVRLAPNIAWIA